MSETPEQFVLSIDRFADEWVEEQVVAVTQKLALTGLSGCVLKSPVGNPSLWKNDPPPGYVGGRFRANWNVGIGAIDYSTSEDIDPSGSVSINRGTAVIEKAPVFQAIWISNNLPYANRLENGWSTQAPEGMVALTFAELESMVA